MSKFTELEEFKGIKEEDKTECPYLDDDNTCNGCKIGITIETCEELYERWLLEN